MSSVPQFFELLWLILIGTPSGMLKDADRTKIEAWIDLETGFQFLCFREKFQFAEGSWGAACSLLGLGS